MINFVIPTRLLAVVDRLAQKESRTRSDLLREAARMYIVEKEQKDKDFIQIKKSANQIKLNEDIAIRMIDEVRKTLPMNR